MFEKELMNEIKKNDEGSYHQRMDGFIFGPHCVWFSVYGFKSEFKTCFVRCLKVI